MCIRIMAIMCIRTIDLIRLRIMCTRHTTDRNGNAYKGRQFPDTVLAKYVAAVMVQLSIPELRSVA